MLDIMCKKLWRLQMTSSSMREVPPAPRQVAGHCSPAKAGSARPWPRHLPVHGAFCLSLFSVGSPVMASVSCDNLRTPLGFSKVSVWFLAPAAHGAAGLSTLARGGRLALESTAASSVTPRFVRTPQKAGAAPRTLPLSPSSAAAVPSRWRFPHFIQL